MSTQETIIGIIAKVCEVAPAEVKPESSIGDFPAWDSIGHLTILSQVETAFNINFEPEEMMDLESVTDIVNAVEGKL